jgi:hypothetical protein
MPHEAFPARGPQLLWRRNDTPGHVSMPHEAFPARGPLQHRQSERLPFGLQGVGSHRNPLRLRTFAVVHQSFRKSPVRLRALLGKFSQKSLQVISVQGNRTFANLGGEAVARPFCEPGHVRRQGAISLASRWSADIYRLSPWIGSDPVCARIYTARLPRHLFRDLPDLPDLGSAIGQVAGTRCACCTHAHPAEVRKSFGSLDPPLRMSTYPVGWRPARRT